MIGRRLRTFLLLAMGVLLSFGSSSAQNKVVVIPLVEKEFPAPVAAVSPPDSAYKIGTSIVTDRVTGLVWQKIDDNTTRNWNDAWSYCANNDAGLPGTGWRLPSVNELMSIVDYNNSESAINSNVFPNTNTSIYWTATTLRDLAWVVDFDGNGYLHISGESSAGYVRCVR